jgi:hypothetical protein
MQRPVHEHVALGAIVRRPQKCALAMSLAVTPTAWDCPHGR